jgi:hypothetical protein
MVEPPRWGLPTATRAGRLARLSRRRRSDFTAAFAVAVAFTTAALEGVRPMGLLAPLYFAGLLAVALPIVFHLFRRAPSGRQAFSSLMFLTPSPPRLTRRSRLTNILLLLLRAAALALLAFAFARPFLPSADDPATPSARGRRVAVLVDTSASMRRGDLWPQAVAQAENALAELKPADEAALYFFDRAVRPGLTFAEWAELAPAVRSAAFRARLAEAKPTWAGTRLGDALATAADLLTEEEGGQAARGATSSAAAALASSTAAAKSGPTGRQLVLISDLQQGGHAEALQGHQWPDGLLLDVRAVTAKQPTNASVRLLEPTADGSAADAPASSAGVRPSPAAVTDEASLRVRVTNQPGATKEQFTLAWATDRGPVAGAEPLKVYVPAGRSQVVRVPWPAGGRPDARLPDAQPVGNQAASSPSAATQSVATTPPPAPAARSPDRLVLGGDDADFDNAVYVVPPAQDEFAVVYFGDDAADDVKGLRYYLQGALADTDRRRVELLVRRSADMPAPGDWLGVRLAVVTTALPEGQASAVRRFAEGGGDVLWVLPDAAAAGGLGRTVGINALAVAEAPAADFALLGRVDLAHPLFAPFADARFADFTKVHFWKHRRVTLPAAAAARVPARFDDGDPFLVEFPVGLGRVWVATSGWQPADSQLALSTKFVPLINGMVARRDGVAVDAQQTVYEPIALPPAEYIFSIGSTPGATGGPTTASSWTARALLTPDGRRIEQPAGATATAAEAVDRPGIYRLSVGGRETPVAVNLPADEGRTAPLDALDLERLGAKLGVAPTSEELVVRQRQLRTAELENRQKLWRWVILAVLGLLAVETVVAGVLARRAGRDPGEPGAGAAGTDVPAVAT